jgi:rare lipoprotein A
MPSNSSSCAVLSVLPLTKRDNGAIASALAPLMVLIVNVAAPKPAAAHEAEAAVAARTFVTPQGEPPVRADADTAVVRFADAWRPCLRIDTALPPLPAVIAAAGATARPALMREPIVGAASMYNPLADDKASGGEQTASGELYDALAWTAAIQIGLRGRFGGVRYGREYRDAYALVESGDKRAIVKINDVGPLRPGRVIDFNERTMRYFDASLEVGVVPSVRITPLDGDDWTPGPVEHDNAIFAAPAEGTHPPHAQIVAAMN